MRIVVGKNIRHMDAAEMAAWISKHQETTVDVGTGDGRFVRHLSWELPKMGAIGVDLTAANLRIASRAAAGNALYVIADALALPEELSQVADHITINFPWGSLLRGLLGGDQGPLTGLRSIGKGGTRLEITLNAGAVAESGWTLDAASERMAAVPRDAGVTVRATSALGRADLRRLPTTWSKRLAFGRDPRAIRIEAVLS